MFRTNWEWISKKKKEEHVHNHRHLLTCLRKTTQVLQDRKKYWQKIPHLTFLQFPQSVSIPWTKSHTIQCLNKNESSKVWSVFSSAQQGLQEPSPCSALATGEVGSGDCRLVHSRLLQQRVIFVRKRGIREKGKRQQRACILSLCPAAITLTSLPNSGMGGGAQAVTTLCLAQSLLSLYPPWSLLPTAHLWVLLFCGLSLALSRTSWATPEKPGNTVLYKGVENTEDRSFFKEPCIKVRRVHIINGWKPLEVWEESDPVQNLLWQNNSLKTCNFSWAKFRMGAGALTL